MTDYLNLAPFCFFSLNEEGKIVAVNDATCQLLGIAREELVMHNISSFVSLGTRIFFKRISFPCC